MKLRRPGCLLRRPALRECTVTDLDYRVAHQRFRIVADELCAMCEWSELAGVRMQLELVPDSHRRHRATDLAQFARCVQFQQRDLRTHSRLGQKFVRTFEQKEHRAGPRMLGK